jgi:hypothetical protein
MTKPAEEVLAIVPTPEEKPVKKQKSVKVSTPLVRKHTCENVNKNNIAGFLDKLHAGGGIVLAINISRDIGGTYEIISYREV